MALGKDNPSSGLGWRILIVYGLCVLAAGIVTILVLFTNVFRTSEQGTVPYGIWLMACLLLLVIVILVLQRVIKILDVLEESNTKLERIVGLLEKNRGILAQINDGVRLSDAAKTISSRGADIQLLREEVSERLEERDFEAAERTIDEIARCQGYEELARQLREQASDYRGGLERERTDQVIARIEMLFESSDWVGAGAQIEEAAKAFLSADEAKALRQRLQVKMEDRKKVLLAAWNDAVQRGATDRSLEILKELDLYLTPNEGLALQETAKDIFRTKLQNLGVQFSLAVSGKHWAKALEIGERITRDFPNSKMADEIRGKLDVLRQRVEEHTV